MSIVFDTDELDFVSVQTNSGPAARAGRRNQFSQLTALDPTVDEAAGVIGGFFSGTSGPGCLGCTITLGSVRFHVVRWDNPYGDRDVQAGFIGLFEQAYSTENLSVWLEFGAATIGLPVPEPGTGLMVSLGVLSLAWSRRRLR